MPDYPRVTPGLFIPGRSSVSVAGLSSRERSGFRASTGFWLRVGGEFVDSPEVAASTLRDGLEMGLDVPVGTPWQAGPQGAKTQQSGVTKAIRALALGYDSDGDLRIHQDRTVNRSFVPMGKLKPETRTAVDAWLSGRDPATMDLEPYWRRACAAEERGEANPWRVAAVETLAAEQEAEASKDAPTAWSHEEQQAMTVLRSLSPERRAELLASL